ncbi:hypothetical protein YTPLAS18_28600 [Nitrospira sp.]|nr:hypothetical protein YTPLAS18_28600 [Nitrospira sp.]
MHRGLFTVFAVLGLTAMTAGCSHYYRVTDPASGKSYYTTEVGHAGRAGAVKFKDHKSENIVTLQSSEVKEISSDEFKAGLATQPGASK